jgi:hypothetical protein
MQHIARLNALKGRMAEEHMKAESLLHGVGGVGGPKRHHSDHSDHTPHHMLADDDHGERIGVV